MIALNDHMVDIHLTFENLNGFFFLISTDIEFWQSGHFILNSILDDNNKTKVQNKNACN